MSLARMGSVAVHRNVFRHSSNGGVGCNQQRFLPWAVARQRLDATLDGMLGGKSEDVERGEGRGGLGGCRLKVGEALARTGPLLSSLDSMRLFPSRSLSLSLPSTIAKFSLFSHN